MSDINGDKLRGHIDTMVLSLLDRGEAHGFEVLRRLESKGCGLLQLKEGTVYPALYRLEEAGCVEARWEDDANRHRGPRRRIYRLTKKGKRELARHRRGWHDFVNVVGRIVGVPT